MTSYTSTRTLGITRLVSTLLNIYIFCEMSGSQGDSDIGVGLFLHCIMAIGFFGGGYYNSYLLSLKKKNNNRDI